MQPVQVVRHDPYGRSSAVAVLSLTDRQRPFCNPVGQQPNRATVNVPLPIDSDLTISESIGCVETTSYLQQLDARAEEFTLPPSYDEHMFCVAQEQRGPYRSLVYRHPPPCDCADAPPLDEECEELAAGGEEYGEWPYDESHESIAAAAAMMSTHSPSCLSAEGSSVATTTANGGGAQSDEGAESKPPPLPAPAAKSYAAVAAAKKFVLPLPRSKQQEAPVEERKNNNNNDNNNDDKNCQAAESKAILQVRRKKERTEEKERSLILTPQPKIVFATGEQKPTAKTAKVPATKAARTIKKQPPSSSSRSDGPPAAPSAMFRSNNEFERLVLALASDDDNDEEEDEEEETKQKELPKRKKDKAKKSKAKKERLEKLKEEEFEFLMRLQQQNNSSEEQQSNTGPFTACRGVCNVFGDAQSVQGAARQLTNTLNNICRKAAGEPKAAARHNILTDGLKCAKSVGTSEPVALRVALSNLFLQLADAHCEHGDQEEALKFIQKFQAAMFYQGPSPSTDGEMLGFKKVCALGALLFVRVMEKTFQPDFTKALILVGLRLAIEVGNVVQVSWLLFHLSNVYEMTGPLPMMIRIQKLAQKISERTNDTNLLNELLFLRGALLQSSLSFSGAVEVFRQLSTAEDRNCASKSVSSLSQVYLQQSCFAQAIEIQEKEVAAARNSDSVTQATTLNMLSIVEMHAGLLSPAIAHSREAVGKAAGARAADCKLVECLSQLGGILLKDGQVEESRRVHLQELDLAKKQGEPSGIARGLMNMGAAEAALGRLEKGEEHFISSLKMIDAISVSDMSFMTRLTCCETQWKAVDGLQRLHLGRASHFKALQFADLKHVAIDARPILAKGLGTEQQTISQQNVSELMAAHRIDAIVHYSLSWEETIEFLIYVVTPDETFVRSAELTRGAMSSLLHSGSPLVKLIFQQSGSDTSVIPTALWRLVEDPPADVECCLHALYGCFIAPVEDLLPHKKGQEGSEEGEGVVCFVPDGMLTNIPFHALRKDNMARRLIERYCVTCAPSLLHLNYAATRHRSANSIASPAAPVQNVFVVAAGQQRARWAPTSEGDSVLLVSDHSGMAAAPLAAEGELGGEKELLEEVVDLCKYDLCMDNNVLLKYVAFGELGAPPVTPSPDLAYDHVLSPPRSKEGSKELFKAVHAPKMAALGLRSVAARCNALVVDIPIVTTMKEEFRDYFALREGVRLFSSEDVARTWDLSVPEAVAIPASACSTWRMVHDTSVPMPQALLLAGARRVLCQLWLPPSSSKVVDSVIAAIAGKEERATVAGAVRKVLIAAIGTASFEDWAGVMQIGLP